MTNPENHPVDPLNVSHDAEVLERLGYRQELERRLSQFSNFSVSFSIICILAGGINSLAQATSGAGGAGVGLGWPLGCMMSGVFALSMAQIASSFPTAGGLYHWASVLGSRSLGWLTAWLNLFGLITVLGSVNVGAWTFLVGAFGKPLGIENTLVNQMIFLAVLGGLQAWVNHRGIRATARLTDFSGYLILVTCVVIVVVVGLKIERWEWERLVRFENFTGPAGGDVWPRVSGAWPFLLGLLLPIYTITGYDASAHTSEETMNAETTVPRGMVMSVLYASLAGYVLLSVMVLAIPRMGVAAGQGWNVFFWLMDERSPGVMRAVICGGILVAQLLCGLAAVTSASRMIYAFARDEGLPCSARLASVSTRFRTPAYAIWTASILAFLFVWGSSVITVAGSTAYAMVVSCTVILLFMSCVIPIVCGMISAGTERWPEAGAWSMGFGWFRFFGVLSVISMIAIIVLGVRPPNEAALGVCAGVLGLLAVYWFGYASRRFKGPRSVTASAGTGPRRERTR